MNTITLLLASATCCLSAVPAIAANGNVPLTVSGTKADDPNTIRVAYGDLGLANANDAAVLRARVERATQQTCGALYDGTTPFQRSTCVDIARRVTEPQITAAIARAGTGKSLAVGSVVLHFARD